MSSFMIKWSVFLNLYCGAMQNRNFFFQKYDLFPYSCINSFNANPMEKGINENQSCLQFGDVPVPCF